MNKAGSAKVSWGPEENKSPLELAQSLDKLSDCDRVRPLRELAQIGDLQTLEYVMPLIDRGSSFLRRLARNAAIKIILCALKEDESGTRLGMNQKQQLLDCVVALDKKYSGLKAMELNSQRTRERIYEILIHEDQEFTARTVAEILDDSDPCTRACAVKLIAEMLELQEITLLVKLLNDPNPRVRANVLESLGASGDKTVQGILRKYRHDKDNRVRATALKGLWNLGIADIGSDLEEMLVDVEPQTRASAAWVIGETGHGQETIKKLIKYLENDRDAGVKKNVTQALNKIRMKEEGVKILIANSDLQQCRASSQQLAADGFQAEIAVTGTQALEVARRQIPYIVLLDLRLPEKNGIEVIRELKSDDRFTDSVIIVCCEFGSHSLIERARQAGASTYLIKPLTYEKIRSKIRFFI